MKFCNNCGTAITEDGQKFCPGCGANLATQEVPVQQPVQPENKAQQTSMAQPAAPVTAAPVVETPAFAATPAAAASGQSMFWHDVLSKKLMNVAAVILVLLGVLMWTGGIYQHVIFRMSEEGRVMSVALNAAQGGYNDILEDPSALIDDMPQLESMGESMLSEAKSSGKMAAKMIDEADFSFTSDYLYEQFGFMHFVDILFGLIMIVLGLLAFVTGQNLSHYKRDAVQIFNTYNIAVIGAVVIYGILYNFVLSPFSDFIEIFTLPYFIIVLGLVASLVYNKEYYAKRQHMFVN